MVDPVRRGGDRADVRQRRGAQAGVAHAADRRSGSSGCSSAPGCPRASCAPCTAAARWARRSSSRARPRSSSRARWRSGAASGVACAERMKGSVLELGGKDPMLVLADANLPNAIGGRALGRLRQRRPDLLGHRARVRGARGGRAVHRRRGGRARSKLRVGDPMDWDTEIGPMVSREQFELVRELVDDAVANGAELRCGGPAEGRRADCFAPAVLTGVTHDMRIMREEIFGPVVPVIDGRLRGGGDRPGQRLRVRPRRVGVDAGPRARRADRAADRSPGMVWINDHMYSHGACSCAWGGVKDSGLGRSHSKFGFYECVNVKLISWEPVAGAATSGGTPTTGRSAARCTPRRSCSTAATTTRPRRCAAARRPTRADRAQGDGRALRR